MKDHDWTDWLNAVCVRHYERYGYAINVIGLDSRTFNQALDDHRRKVDPEVPVTNVESFTVYGAKGPTMVLRLGNTGDEL